MDSQHWPTMIPEMTVEEIERLLQPDTQDLWAYDPATPTGKV
jgi:hypothetical protein